VLSAANQCSLSNYVVCSEMFAAKLLSLLNCVAYNEPILLSNYGAGSKLVFAAELWCWQRISFRCGIMVAAANQFSLSNYGGCSESVLLPICVACSEPVSLSNCVVFSELVSLPN